MTQLTTITLDRRKIPTRLAGPTDGSVPAVVVVPSIFGPTDELLGRLAELGDRALVVAPDPFWRTGEGPLAYGDHDTAFGRLAKFDFAKCGEEMNAAASWAKERSNGTVVALGICFGGPFVLRMAAAGIVDGVVTWHGSRMEQALGGAESITCPMRHHIGTADPIAPPEAVEAMRQAFAGLDDVQLIMHEGAAHGFSHDGDAFDEAAYRAGFSSVVELLRV